MASFMRVHATYQDIDAGESAIAEASRINIVGSMEVWGLGHPKNDG